LTIIKNALRIVKRVYDVDIDINTIPLDDEKAFQLFQRGDTTGVFQLESAGMKRYLRELKPSVFEDIVAMVALYRPGPMQFIDSFIKRKHGEEAISYLHAGMEPALSSTYGILVYQEQFMQISKDFSGFTGGQADTLRKAVGKKKIDLMRKVKVDFVEGAISHSGARREIAEKFWDQLEEFANYCFNKSHAACYGLISYQTAYLKAHFPAAFMAALMTSDYDDTDRLAIEIAECKKMGMTVMNPDVNESFGEFAVVKDTSQIRFGMNAIKNVGAGAVDEIIRAREENGKFASLEDFLSAVNTRTVNRKAIESLIKAGGFDRFGDRSTLLHNLDLIIAYGQRLQKERASGQTDLFGNVIDDVITAKPTLKLDVPPAKLTPRELLGWERELLGLFLSQQPLEAFSVLLAEQTVPITSLKPEHDSKAVIIGGVVVDAREIVTKKGQKMAFVKLEDEFGETELILFPSTYQQTIGLWERDRIVIVRGKINAKDREGNMTNEVKILVDDAREVTHEQAAAYQTTGRKQRELKVSKRKGSALAAAVSAAKAERVEAVPKPTRVYIRLLKSDDHDMLQSLKMTIDAQRGESEVVLVLGPDTAKQAIKLPTRMSSDTAALARLQALVGTANVVLQ
jgi:DNA polymerase-3 subunit alpha